MQDADGNEVKDDLPCEIAIQTSLIEKRKGACDNLTIQHTSFKSGVATIKVTTAKSKDFVDNQLSLLLTCTLPSNKELTPETQSFTVTDYKISFTTKPPKAFYKDSGGKGKMMDVLGTIYDQYGATPKRSINLTTKLFYEDGSEVPDQSILTVSTCSHTLEGDVRIF